MPGIPPIDVYKIMPLVAIIRDREMLHDFPYRTETDLYLWIVKYQSELAKGLGWAIIPDTTASLLASRFNASPKRLVHKLQTRFRNWLYGPPTKKWREGQLAAHQGRMFADILVVFSGHMEEREMLDFGAYVAQMEGAQIFGLCILAPDTPNQDIKLNLFQKDFDERCTAARVSGSLAFAFDKNPGPQIIRRARFADLVVLPLGGRNFSQKHIQSLIQNCPTPIMGIPSKTTTPLKKALLAYDGSPQAGEALYLAAYVAKFWGLALVVLAVAGKRKISPATLLQAGEYLEHYNIPSEFIKASGPPAAAASLFAVEKECDLIIAGGYGANPIKKIFTGRMIDEIIEKATHPVLICR